MKYRIETDFLGEMKIPSDAYYGIHTMRAVDNFPIADVAISVYPNIVIAYAMVKLACAKANNKLGLLKDEVYEPIASACKRIINGEFHDQFIVEIIQGGAGTSTNMNANEVIANVALEFIGKEKGDYEKISPLKHVNMSQSTNDTYPTALLVGFLKEYDFLLEAIKSLSDAFYEKGREFSDVIKMGRTQLQDAVPMTLGQEFNAFGDTLNRDIERLNEMSQLFLEINIGATAIGTGINSHVEYPALAVEALAELSGLPLVLAPHTIEATSDTSAFVSFSSVLKRVAIKLSKISNDLRLLSSGPIAGFNEINLPAVQAGSSIMPGKVNPVIPEAVNQTAFQVIGNDLVISLAAEGGQMQLNAFEPVLAVNILRSLRYMTNAMLILRTKCVNGITANVEVCAKYVEQSPGIATFFTPHLGYKESARIAKKALKEGLTVREIIIQEGLMTEEQVNEVLHVDNLTKPNISNSSV
jgi:aspartate ammonia-lyase